MYGYGNSFFLTTRAILARTASGGGVDPDAQAFITAAAITNPTQQAAINTLVVDLKGYNIWTKFKAIYPIVGGVASAHAVNLKTPGTFNLTFATGVTHSANGMLGNGSTGYANSNFNPNLNGATLNSHHVSFYSRTNTNGTEVEFGSQSGGIATLLEIRTSGTTYAAVNSFQTYTTFADTDSRGLYIANRTASNVINVFRNSTKTVTGATNSVSLPGANYFILAWNNGTPQFYSTKQCAFASIGDGLTDTEAANFYTAVQAYQTTLGRSIGTQTVSDADAQAFVTAANITDQVEANAVNNLVIGMKADGLWTKMKAIYPIVGGVASSHAVNLKTPGTFNLTFSSGWTHSSTGMTPTNAYADTALNTSTQLNVNSHSFGMYSRTNNTTGSQAIGSFDNTPRFLQNNLTAANFVSGLVSSIISYTANPSTSLLMLSRTSSTLSKAFRAGVLLGQETVAMGTLPTFNFYLGARNDAGSAALYSVHQCAFAFIGDGLSDTEATNYYNRVQTYQTTLNRNV